MHRLKTDIQRLIYHEQEEKNEDVWVIHNLTPSHLPYIYKYSHRDSPFEPLLKTFRLTKYQTA